jgi:prevent-host-death family protein
MPFDTGLSPTKLCMMKVINMHEAKTHLSRLVEEALAGEVIVVAKSGKPLVKLVPVGALSSARPLGWLAGQVEETPDCWDEDHEVTAWFYGDHSEAAAKVAE